VGLTNAFLWLELSPDVRLAELKPIAQVVPDTIELSFLQEEGKYVVRLGDIMTQERIILTNLYLGKLSLGNQAIARVKVRYDNPALNEVNLYSEVVEVNIQVEANYQPQTNPEVEKSILTLAKYRQTQLAEAKLEQGDHQAAATLLQTAAKTAIQLGDETAATVLQTSATRLQTQGELSESEKKKTRMVSKTRLH
jgi:Ca-activated chloride channel family protein